ncbi:MAG: DUF523 domain-containing protein [Christensenellaceae bacterium]
MSDKIVVSACLAGKKCRYDGSSRPNQRVMQLIKDKKALAACPECMAGLKIPRVPAEIVGGDGHDVLKGTARVYNRDNKDVTQEFVRGAHKFLKFVQVCGASTVYVKSKSPSCAKNHIYDGTFHGILKDGCGVACALLVQNGIVVKEISDEEE